ncbi:hypothetical protein ACFLYP_02065 [Chloroflexota bacterium]
MKHSNTPGGNRLLALRGALGKTQLDVELDADIGSGYLQRVESGKVKQPERETLERILGALGARYTERRDILELFGYVVETSLPTSEETIWAVETCHQVLESVSFPAYLLDCSHRLLTWNKYTPKLFGLDTASKDMEKLADVSMLLILFDPKHGISQLIHNPDTFFDAAIRALRYEMRLFRGENWYKDVINDLMKLPLFEKYWTSVKPDSPYPTAARPLVPIELNVPLIGLLKFRLASEILAEDRRFRIIYYLPADSKTMKQCAIWSDQA